MQRKKLTIGLWTLALLTFAFPLVFLLMRWIDGKDFLLSLVIPALLLVFQLAWDRRAKGRRR
jgi:uncharacterized membrane protein YccC